MAMVTKLMPTPGPDLAGLAEFMTRTVFDACRVAYTHEISIADIKSMIECNHPDLSLLLMICCGDMHTDNYISN
jgi:hypothetical protein